MSDNNVERPRGNERFVRECHRFACLIIVTVLAGCATTRDYSSVKTLSAPQGEERKTIVLMPLDVELSKLTAGGVLEPHADWTTSAKRHMVSSVRSQIGADDLDFVQYTAPAEGEIDFAPLNDLERLHGAVGQAILLHKYAVPLGTKKNTFDWSLGKTVSILRERSKASHALFIYLRDSYSTTGRVLVQIAWAILGSAVAGGHQIGFASLVNLTNGNVVWFNHLSSATGDLRTAGPAAKTVESLLNGLPR